ncbi:uncharacterized protein METZ01_LOCUS209901, partial [marine metagenome]
VRKAFWFYFTLVLAVTIPGRAFAQPIMEQL